MSVIRHYTASLTVQFDILQWRTVGTSDGAAFRVGDHAIEALGLGVGDATPVRFVAGNIGTAMRLGPVGQALVRYFMLLETEYVDGAVPSEKGREGMIVIGRRAAATPPLGRCHC